MKELLLTVIIMCTIGCGTEASNVEEYLNNLPQVIENSIFESEIAEKLDRVEAILGEVPFEIVLVKTLGAKTAGVCRLFGGGAFRIDISEEKWIFLSDVFKTALIAHEVFHCLFKAGHIKEGVDRKSLMDPILNYSAQCLVENDLKFCIEEALYQRETGKMKNAFEGECNHHSHD